MIDNDVTAQVTEGVAEQVSFIQKFISEIQADFISLLIKVLFAIVVLIIGMLIIRIIRKAIRKALNKASDKIGLSSIKFIDQTINVILYAVLIIIIAQYFGVSAASVVALLGSAGLTVGLAFQGALSNFAGGFLLLLHRPFKVGDYIVISGGQAEGVVTEIGMIHTTLALNPRQIYTIPNGSLANSTIVNMSKDGTRLLAFTVGISYRSDIQKAKKIMLDIAKNDEHMIDDENLMVYVSNLAESSVELGLRGLVAQSQCIPTKWRLQEQIKLAFDREGIEIPFNQLDVHVVQQ